MCFSSDNNYPVSNVPFVSRLVERAVAKQINTHAMISVKLTAIFSLRAAPIGDIIRNHNLSFLCDDDLLCHFDLIVASLTAAVHQHQRLDNVQHVAVGSEVVYAAECVINLGVYLYINTVDRRACCDCTGYVTL